MKPSRIVLILVALLAGGLAAYLATRGGGAPTPATKVAVAPAAPAPTTKVLVAKTDIGLGERLTAGDLEWRDWPADGISAQYITNASMPDAPKQLDGAIARFEIFPGDPIRDDKLVKSDQGYLSAVLAKGMRGVSVRVTPASGSGGFIVPNDHVDVVSTHGNPGGGHISETILENVRVLAIGKQLGPKKGSEEGDDAGKGFSGDTIATLELDPGRAQLLINAAQTGSLSLVLRSVADFAQAVDAPSSVDARAIRVIRWGQTTSIQTGGANTAPATLDTASYEPPAPVNPLTTTAPGPTPESAPRPVLK